MCDVSACCVPSPQPGEERVSPDSDADKEAGGNGYGAITGRGVPWAAAQSES